MNNKILFASDLKIDTSHIPAELGFVLIYPFPQEKKYIESNSSMKPSIWTFRDQNQTMLEILSQYKQCINELKQKKNICFQISNGRRLSPKLSLAQLAKRLSLTSVDGIVFYVGRVIDKKKDLQEIDSDQQTNYLDQSALQTYYQNSNKQIEDALKFNINFKTPDSEYVITIKAKGNDKTAHILKQLAQKVNKYFQVDLKDLQGLHFQLELKDRNKSRIPLKIEGTIKSIKGLVNWSNVFLLTQKKIKFQRKIEHPEHKIIIFKENSDSEYIIESFEEIQCMSFHNLYFKKLASPDKRKDQSNMICLKVMDILIRQDQNLSVLAPYFKGQQKTIINLVGRVVSEKMYFYNTMDKLQKSVLKTFKIEDYVRPGNGSEEREAFRSRLRQKIEQRAKKADIDHFKDMNHVEPIFIYTSQDIHHNEVKTSQKSEPIYTIINRFLREQPLLNKTQQQIVKDWKYLYTSSLVGQLKVINPQKQTVYRGVDYNPNVREGQLLTFKPFTSTSLSEHVAHGFFQRQHNSTDHTLFIMKIRSGKSIKRFSAFEGEQQLLLEPYTQFRVTKVTTKKQQKSTKTITFRIVQLNQLEQKQSSSVYPQSFDNIIVWVDRDKKKSQSETIYKQIQVFKHPTLLVQFTSTQKLREWLAEERTQNVFKDQTSRIVLITNMARYEGDTQNKSAGVDAIVQVQKIQSHRQIPIFLFVGYIEGTKMALDKRAHEVKNPDKILIGSQWDEVMKFLSKNLQVSFKKVEVSHSENPEKKSLQMKKASSQQIPGILNKPKKIKSQISSSNKGDCLLM